MYESFPMIKSTSYLETIKNIPILTSEQEQELFRLYHEEGNESAVKKLIHHHIRSVYFIVRQYKFNQHHTEDLIHEGVIALMKAIKKFDPDKKVRLWTFAVHEVRAVIVNYILDNFRQLRIATTHGQRKLFYNLIRMKSDKYQAVQRDQAEQIAKQLNVRVDEVLEMDRRLFPLNYTCLDTPLHSDDGNEIFMEIPDDTYNPVVDIMGVQQEQQVKHVLALLDHLPERSKDILTERFLTENPPTLEKLSCKYNVSTERVRQIEQQALHQMKELCRLHDLAL